MLSLSVALNAQAQDKKGDSKALLLRQRRRLLKQMRLNLDQSHIRRLLLIKQKLQKVCLLFIKLKINITSRFQTL
jgi:hypothetical protein